MRRNGRFVWSKALICLFDLFMAPTLRYGRISFTHVRMSCIWFSHNNLNTSYVNHSELIQKVMNHKRKVKLDYSKPSSKNMTYRRISPLHKSRSLWVSIFTVFAVFRLLTDFVCLWVLTFPLEDCSEFGNFVITLMIVWYSYNIMVLFQYFVKT